jgi:hypothetical protein
MIRALLQANGTVLLPAFLRADLSRQVEARSGV